MADAGHDEHDAVSENWMTSIEGTAPASMAAELSTPAKARPTMRLGMADIRPGRSLWLLAIAHTVTTPTRWTRRSSELGAFGP